MSRFPAPEHWGRLAPLLEQALDLPPAERASFLDRVCAGDTLLRAEIEALLRADSDAGTFLGAPVDLSAISLQPGEEIDEAEGPAAAGTMIGPYRVVREIGRGGMGVVYEAAQERPRRHVALKVILGGRHVDATTVRMFQREADSLARLKHAGIAAIYEAGSTGEGQHYFAMELVQGRPLSDLLRTEATPEGGAAAPATRAEQRGRLALFQKICAAVAYAHQRGVIHRDLKPSNILVQDPAATGGGAAAPASADGVPEIKILDFGLARITDPEAGEATAVTAVGNVRGTLPYMSPEQVRGRSDEVDVRSDVYALGVILYRLLTGRLPLEVDWTDFPEAVRVICEEPPRPPGAAAPGAAKIDRDLSIVVLKALEKDPARRYVTVAALEEDVARYLEGQPILARRPSALYQMHRLVARHKAPFAAAGLMLIALVAFGVVAALQARRIAAERDRANREAQTARRVSGFMTDLFKVADPDEARGGAISAREILDQGVGKIGKELASEPEVQARLLLTMGIVYGNLGLMRQAQPMLEQAVETRRRVLGEEHPDTLEAMKTLATLDANLDRLPEAERLFTQVVAARRRLLGEERPETIEAVSGLANVYQRQGRYAEAEGLARQVLETRRRVLGEEHPDTIRSLAALGNAYRMERRLPEAEKLLVTATAAMRRVLGEENSETLSAIGTLSDVYINEGRYAEAESLSQSTIDTLRRVLGPDHPRTLQAMNSLAMLYDEQERYPEAERIHVDVLARRRRLFGDDHASTLTSMNNLANIYLAEGRYQEAAALFLESLPRVRRLLGENHPDTTNTLYNLGCLAALQGDRKGALDWLSQAVEHGYSHWDRMPKDSDLKTLVGDPRFQAIVERARKNAGP